MIIRGTIPFSSSRKACKTYLWMVQNIQLTGFISKMARIDNPVIGFIMPGVSTTHMTMHS